MSSRKHVLFSDADRARQSAARLQGVATARDAAIGPSQLPRFAPGTRASGDKWSSFMQQLSRRWDSHNAFITSPEGLLVATHGPMDRMELEAIAAQLSSALGQGLRLPEAEGAELIVQVEGKTWICATAQTPLGFFIFGCVLTRPPYPTSLRDDVGKAIAALLIEG